MRIKDTLKTYRRNPTPEMARALLAKHVDAFLLAARKVRTDDAVTALCVEYDRQWRSFAGRVSLSVEAFAETLRVRTPEVYLRWQAYEGMRRAQVISGREAAALLAAREVR